MLPLKRNHIGNDTASAGSIDEPLCPCVIARSGISALEVVVLGRHVAAASAITISLGGCVVAAASLMPWSWFDSILFSLFSMSGLDLGYGFLTLFAGIGLVAIGARALGRPLNGSLAWAAVALAAVAVVVPLIARVDLDLRGDEGPLQIHPAGRTLWIYVVEIGGLAALLGAFGLRVSLRSQRGGNAAPPPEPAAPDQRSVG